jgi:hypothetical protein
LWENGVIDVIEVIYEGRWVKRRRNRGATSRDEKAIVRGARAGEFFEIFFLLLVKKVL